MVYMLSPGGGTIRRCGLHPGNGAKSHDGNSKLHYHRKTVVKIDTDVETGINLSTGIA